MMNSRISTPEEDDDIQKLITSGIGNVQTYTDYLSNFGLSIKPSKIR